MTDGSAAGTRRDQDGFVSFWFGFFFFFPVDTPDSLPAWSRHQNLPSVWLQRQITHMESLNAPPTHPPPPDLIQKPFQEAAPRTEEPQTLHRADVSSRSELVLSEFAVTRLRPRVKDVAFCWGPVSERPRPVWDVMKCRRRREFVNDRASTFPPGSAAKREAHDREGLAPRPASFLKGPCETELDFASPSCWTSSRTVSMETRELSPLDSSRAWLRFQLLIGLLSLSQHFIDFSLTQLCYTPAIAHGCLAR